MTRRREATLEICEFLVVYFCMVVASGVLFGSVGCIRSCWLLVLVCRVRIGPCHPTARASPRTWCRLPFGHSFLVVLALVRYPSLRPQPVGPAHTALIDVGPFCMKVSSASSARSQIVCRVAYEKAMYSASIVERAIVVCFFELQATLPFPTRKA